MAINIIKENATIEDFVTNLKGKYSSTMKIYGEGNPVKYNPTWTDTWDTYYEKAKDEFAKSNMNYKISAILSKIGQGNLVFETETGECANQLTRKGKLYQVIK